LIVLAFIFGSRIFFVIVDYFAIMDRPTVAGVITHPIILSLKNDLRHGTNKILLLHNKTIEAKEADRHKILARWSALALT
jgi:hypothetical protein